MDQSKASKQAFQRMVKEASPKSKMTTNCLKAFCVGGTICTIGQLIQNTLMQHAVTKDDAGMYTSVVLIFMGALLTGLGIYGKIGKFAGAGSLVPITGFANSVAAPAIEFKKEGLVLGVGAKMFIVAGPVIVYGLLASVVVGTIYYFMK